MIKRICKQCEKEMSAYPSRIKNGRGMFCSNECKYKFRKGRKPWNTGKKCPQLSESKQGSKNPMWKGGHDKKKMDSEYGKKNRKRIMARQKIWNKNNRERVRKYKSKWSKNNPDKRAIIWNRRREREIQSGGKLTIEQWEKIKEKQEQKCAECKVKTKLTIDHKIPVSKWIEWAKKNRPSYKCGDKENIQGLCLNCNSKKSASLCQKQNSERAV